VFRTLTTHSIHTHNILTYTLTTHSLYTHRHTIEQLVTIYKHKLYVCLSQSLSFDLWYNFHIYTYTISLVADLSAFGGKKFSLNRNVTQKKKRALTLLFNNDKSRVKQMHYIVYMHATHSYLQVLFIDYCIAATNSNTAKHFF